MTNGQTCYVRRASKWRCRYCGRLLGVIVGSEIEIRYKESLTTFRGGSVRTSCSRCGEINEVDVAKSPLANPLTK